MTSTLARFAENAFWLGRYMERTENLARILQANEVYSRHNSGYRDWQNIVRLYSDTSTFGENYHYEDTNSVLTFYVLDENSPSSLRSTVAAARENARFIRHLISIEMWTHLNIFFSQTEKMNQSDILSNNLAQTIDFFISNCQKFEGIIEGTFIRSETWSFYQLGKFIERADQTTRSLDLGFQRIKLNQGELATSAHWNALLRSISGYHAYRLRYSGPTNPYKIAMFLLYDGDFPRSVTLCINHLSDRLDDLTMQSLVKPHEIVKDAIASVLYLINEGPKQMFTADELHKFLDNLQISLGNLSRSIEKSYF